MPRGARPAVSSQTTSLAEGSLQPTSYKDASSNQASRQSPCCDGLQRAASVRRWSLQLSKLCAGASAFCSIPQGSHIHAAPLNSYTVMCEHSNGMLYVESSAKTAVNVAAIFESVAEKLTAPTKELPQSVGLPADAAAAAGAEVASS